MQLMSRFLGVRLSDTVVGLQIHGTCLGHQLLHILVSNVSRNDLLVDTDSVAHPSTLDWTDNAAKSRLAGDMPVSRRTFTCGIEPATWLTGGEFASKRQLPNVVYLGMSHLAIITVGYVGL